MAWFRVNTRFLTLKFVANLKVFIFEGKHVDSLSEASDGTFVSIGSAPGISERKYWEV